MNAAIVKDSIITRNGISAKVVGIWQNIANQTIYNVRLTGSNQMASWLMNGETDPDSTEGSDNRQITLGGSVRIKQHVSKDLSYFLKVARDTRLAMTVVALNPEPGEYQVKVEYELDGHYTKTALFRLHELEVC